MRVGFGIAAAKVAGPVPLPGHNEPFRFWTADSSGNYIVDPAGFHREMPSHVVPTTVAIIIPPGPWPSEALAPPGRYDALKFVDLEQTPLYENWDDDVFEVP